MMHSINGVAYDDARIFLNLPGYRRLKLAESIELTFDEPPTEGQAKGEFRWSGTWAYRFARELGGLDKTFDVDIVCQRPGARPLGYKLLGCAIDGEIEASTKVTIRKVERGA